MIGLIISGTESKEMEVEETTAPVISPASISAAPLATSPLTSPVRTSDAAPPVTSPAGVSASSPVIPPARVHDADPQYMWGHGQSLETGLEQNPGIGESNAFSTYFILNRGFNSMLVYFIAKYFVIR